MIEGTVLILSPHTDDAELGCGGTIHKFKGILPIYTAIVSDVGDVACAENLRNECANSLAILGSAYIFGRFQARDLPRQKVLDWFLELRKQFNPNVVLLPSSYDRHQDHKVVYEEGMRAFKYCTVLGYELPWNHTHFTTDTFISFDASDLRAKTEALRCYRSQQRRPYFSDSFTRSLAIVRGVQAGCAYAEAYEVMRVIQ